MSKSSRKPEASGTAMFRRKGFRVFGLGLQDIIKYFFGGNGSLAIIILVLICVFLAMDAVRFFPDHHKGLKDYRLAGQEYVDLVRAQVDRHTEVYSKANIAYFAEVNESSLEEDNFLRAYRSVLNNVENLADRDWERLEDDLGELEDSREKLDGAGEEESAETAGASDLAGEVASLEKRVEKKQAGLRSRVEKILEDKEAWNLGPSGPRISKEQRERIREAVPWAVPGLHEEEHPAVVEAKERSAGKKKAAAEKFAAFKAAVGEIRDAAKPLKDFFYELRDIGSENKREIVKFSTAHLRREALLKAAARLEDPAEKAEKTAEAEAVDLTEPDYAKLNEPLYASRERYLEIAPSLESAMAAAMAKLPEKGGTSSARMNLARARRAYAEFEQSVRTNRDRIQEWRHDKPLSYLSSTGAFLFGKDWVTNSSWHDFYGLLPLLSGSLLIALVALVVAVPFAVSAAIYVNQLAPAREQNLVKPAIEFIEAIPSVVLGFFGIFVLGESLRLVSQMEWLSWVPGFPMSERLNILNAGLLLAFMAIPTIFTLAEDALNNIPGAFTENSLAMGATKLQTVLRVIVPTALSGIIAAVLLGFGRIVGETMVVLLVAGNKIKIPDFSAGVGVVTQPAHTMTGIIAQELGEVDGGSLHWRALFVVGMVLFTLSLTVNYSAQKVLKKFQKI